jgi:hypothetical protein
VKGGKQVLAVFVAHHTEVDLHMLYTFDHLEAVGYVSGDPVLQGASCGGEGDADREMRPIYLDGPDHVQRDEVASDLRVPYVPQSLPNASLRQTILTLMDRFSICGVGDNLRWRSAGLDVGVSPGPLVYFHRSTSVPPLRPSPIGGPSSGMVS